MFDHLVSIGLLFLFLHTSFVHSATIQLIVDGKVVEIDVEEEFVGILTELAKVIVDTTVSNITIDVNECASNLTHNCNLTVERCVNTDGNFHCVCKIGYLRRTEAGECEIDLCSQRNITCDVSRNCNQDSSDLACVCAPGFQHNGTDCEILTACNLNNCPINSQCFADGSQAICECNAGYEKYEGSGMDTSADGSGSSGFSATEDDIECIDIDECSTGLHNCDPNGAACQNINGSFNCACNDGYTGNGVNCTDIDECSVNDTCDFSSTYGCKNLEGGFECLCTEGFSAIPDDPYKCEEIDECETHDCPDNSTCDNFVGGFQCLCDAGYVMVGSLCEDIEECEIDTDRCGSEETTTCTNTVGSFVCSCKNGYTGNGTNDCIDIEECETGADNCGSEETATCTNTVGGFFCSCNAGYIDNGANECIDSDGAIQVKVVVTSATGRRKREVTDGFTQGLQTLLSTLLTQYGYPDEQVNVTIASKIVNSDGSTSYELVIASDPELRQFLENQLSTISGPIENFDFEEIFYSVTSEFSGTSNVSAFASSTAERLCEQIEQYVLNTIDASNSATNETTFVCNGTITGNTFDFDAVLDGAYAGLFNFSEIFSNFTAFTVESRVVCSLTTCAPNGNCIQHFGSIECTCPDNTLYDINITNPGTTCVSPILPLECNSDNTARISLYIGYFNDHGIDTSTLRLINSSCAGIESGQFLTFDRSFDTCGWTSTFDGDNIVYTNSITNVINGIATNPIEISFPVTCEYPRVFISTNDDDDDPVEISVISTTLIVQNAQNTGSLSATITAYEDANFATALTSDNELLVGTEIYIHATHSASTASNFMKLQSCWATPTTDPSDTPKNELINDGCPVDSAVVNVISNGDAESATFKLAVRPFDSFNKLYLHCEVEVCAAQCQNACSGASGRRRRETKKIDVFTIGPFRTIENGIVGGDDTQDPELPDQTEPGAVNVGGIVAGVVISVIIIVIVVLFVYMKRNRNGYGSSLF